MRLWVDSRGVRHGAFHQRVPEPFVHRRSAETTDVMKELMRGLDRTTVNLDWVRPRLIMLMGGPAFEFGIGDPNAILHCAGDLEDARNYAGLLTEPQAEIDRIIHDALMAAAVTIDCNAEVIEAIAARLCVTSFLDEQAIRWFASNAGFPRPPTGIEGAATIACKGWRYSAAAAA